MMFGKTSQQGHPTYHMFMTTCDNSLKKPFLFSFLSFFYAFSVFFHVFLFFHVFSFLFRVLEHKVKT